MIHFIKLTSKIINIKHINIISILPNKYNIYVRSNDSYGNMFFGSGHLSSADYKVEICANKTPEDYKTVSKWIDSLK